MHNTTTNTQVLAYTSTFGMSLHGDTRDAGVGGERVVRVCDGVGEGLG